MKKIYVIVMIIFFIVFGISFNNNVYADPNSSKGFADFDDNKAAEETKKLEQEEKNKQSDRVLSTNNFLESLVVEGYTLTPDFNKQTIEYTISEEIKSDELTINAKAEDSKAKIQGIGKVKIPKNENRLRIDIEAESGTVRTYFINIKSSENESPKQDDEDLKNELVQNNEIINETNNTIEEKQIHVEKDDNDNNMIIIIVLGVVILFVLILNNSKKKKRKRKH